MTTVLAIRCDKCGDILYSRARHDCRWCSCDLCAIDGGFDYTRIIGTDFRRLMLVLPGVSSRILYDDWNNRFGAHGLDEFGRIPKKLQGPKLKFEKKLR